MDKLEQRLRDDAARINVTVSPQLDDRIRASLHAAAEERRTSPVRASVRSRSSMWWASSLTGLAATLVVVVLLNLWQTEPAPVVAQAPQATPDAGSGEPLAMPVLKAETAMLTAPLQDELDNLEADLKRAEKAVREDIRIGL
jgi:hypothetical protein